MTKRDYYEILNIGRDAGQEDIRRAYRRLARQYHPDVSKDPDAEERFKELTEAYEVLSDSERRAAYDRFGHAGVQNGGGFAGDPFGFGIDTLFENLFGGGRASRRGPRRGADLRYRMTLSFEEAVFGTTKEIEFSKLTQCPRCGGSRSEPGTQPSRCPTCGGSGEVRRTQSSFLGQFVSVSPCDRCQGTGQVVTSPCTECRGQGQVRAPRKLEVSVPAGIDEGFHLRLSGEGEAGDPGAPPGDLFVEFNIRLHKLYRRSGHELFMDMPLNVAQAALGDTVEIPTLDGPVEQKIEPGTQSGDTVRLRGKGVPSLRGGGRGDLVVTFTVVIPRHLNEKQKQLLRQLGDTLEKPQPREGKGFFDKLKETLGI